MKAIFGIGNSWEPRFHTEKSRVQGTLEGLPETLDAVYDVVPRVSRVRCLMELVQDVAYYTL